MDNAGEFRKWINGQFNELKTIEGDIDEIAYGAVYNTTKLILDKFNELFPEEV